MIINFPTRPAARAAPAPVTLVQQVNAILGQPEASAGRIHTAAIGTAITLRQPHRKFGQCYAEFRGHVGDGRHIVVAKLISSRWRSRWTKSMPAALADVLAVHDRLARP